LTLKRDSVMDTYHHEEYLVEQRLLIHFLVVIATVG